MGATIGVVFDIQRAALHDGPGIRTTVFLKGCPLRCLWCHNPESRNPEPEEGVNGKIYGRRMAVEKILDVVEKDRSFFESSGGGMTVSGGEPTFQLPFCQALLEGAKSRRIHTCLDTCGCVSWRKLQPLLSAVDLFLFDYKATGEEEHRRLTGVPQKPILENLERLGTRGARIRLRCPIVPGVNDTGAHFEAIVRLGHLPGIEAIDLMPYHDVGKGKYDELDRPRPHLPTHVPEPDEIASWIARLQPLAPVPVDRG